MADWYFRNKQSGLISCPGCRNLVRNDEEFCPYCARRLRPENGWRGWLKKAFSRDDVATRTLIGIICVLFLLQFITNMFLPAEYSRMSPSGFLNFGAASPITNIRMGSNFQAFVLVFGEIWRFTTSVLLHAGIIHILFNCWAFWDLGRLAEKLWGAKQVFAIFIITGTVASAVSFFWCTILLGQPTNSLGASGALCGILGLMLGSYYRNRYHLGNFLGPQLVRWAVYILIFGLVIRGVDNAAHIGGMLTGAVFGYFLPPSNTTRTLARDTKIWNAAAWAAAAILFVSAIFGIIFCLQGFDHVITLMQVVYGG